MKESLVPRFHQLFADAFEGRIALTVEMHGETPPAIFECDIKQFAAFIQQALDQSDAASRTLLSGAGTPRPGDGSRGVVVLPGEEVVVQPSGRGVQLLIRCGLVDLALRLPHQTATKLASRLHGEAQKAAALRT